MKALNRKKKRKREWRGGGFRGGERGAGIRRNRREIAEEYDGNN